MRYVFSICILILFCPGCTLPHPSDPQKTEALRLEAESLVLRLDYAAAAERLTEALRHQPGNSALYLRQGELLERTDNFAAARRSYQTGLKKVPPGDPRRPELVHRLALLLALKLDASGKARALLPQLPTDSPRRDDLLGIFSSSEGNPRQALLHFNAALAKNPDDDLTAAILYHAALAYRLLGDEKNISQTLYEAINRTRSLATAWDIEKLWKQGDGKTMVHQP